MSGHTPGPWRVKLSEGPFNPKVYSSGALIADVGNASDKMAEFEANARLIAAAPTLLKALQHLSVAFDECVSDADTYFDDWLDVREEVDAAIAQAQGKE